MGKDGTTGYVALSHYYEHLIRSGELAPAQVLPTEIELARQHGVTRTTVRRAFVLLVKKGLVVKHQGRGTFVAAAAAVRERARQRIVIAAPRSLTGTPGVGPLIQGRRNRHYYHYIEAIIDTIGRYARPFIVQYYKVNAPDLSAIEGNLRHDEDLGIITFGVDSRELFDAFVAMPVPVVFLDSVLFRSNVNGVRADNRGAMKALTQHVLRTMEGPLAFLSVRTAAIAGSPHAERLAGFKDAHRDAGRPFDARYVLLGDRARTDVGRTLTGRLLEHQPRPVGILCSDDLLAYGALDVLHAANIGVPGEISVVGFGDGLSAHASRPSLTTAAMDLHTMGARAVELLEEHIAAPDGEPNVISVPATVILRQSTLPILAALAR